MTSTDLVALWRLDQATRLAPGTLSEYERYLRIYEEAHGPLLDAEPAALKTFVAGHPGWSPATRNFARRAVRSFFKWCVEEGLRDDNPALAVRAVKETVPDCRVADTATRDALVGACQSPRDIAFIEVLFGSGARRGEVCALTIGDINTDDWTIRILKSKTGRPRVAPLDPRARHALLKWLAHREAMRPETEAVWLTPHGQPLKPDGAKMLIRRIADRAGVEFSSHDARRGYAVNWLMLGGGETPLQSICGWANSSMVARYSRGAKEAIALTEARRLLG